MGPAPCWEARHLRAAWHRSGSGEAKTNPASPRDQFSEHPRSRGDPLQPGTFPPPILRLWADKPHCSAHRGGSLPTSASTRCTCFRHPKASPRAVAAGQPQRGSGDARSTRSLLGLRHTGHGEEDCGGREHSQHPQEGASQHRQGVRWFPRSAAWGCWGRFWGDEARRHVPGSVSAPSAKGSTDTRVLETLL